MTQGKSGPGEDTSAEKKEVRRCNKCNRILTTQEIVSYNGRCEDCFGTDQSAASRVDRSIQN